MDSVATGAVCGKSISSLIGKAVESVIIRLYGAGGEVELFRNPFRSMALRTGCKSDSSLIHGRIRVYLCLNPVDAMARRASGRIGSPSGGEYAMHTLHKLFRDFRMTGAAGLGNVRSEDHGFGINQRSQVMAPVAIR